MRLKQIHVIIGLGLLLIGLMAVPTELVTQNTEMNIIETTQKVGLSDLTPHAPILIDHNDDFETLGFPGSGSESDPYIIDSLEIKAVDGGSCFETVNPFVTANFTIQNCRFSGSRISEGVLIADGKLAHLKNCEVYNCTDGVSFWAGTQGKMTDCVIFNCSGTGVRSNYAIALDISGCTFDMTGTRGLYLSYAHDSEVSDCLFLANSTHGPDTQIDIEFAQRVSIHDCEILINGDYGIDSSGLDCEVSEVAFTSYSGWAVRQTTYHGLLVSDCTFNNANIQITSQGSVTVENSLFNGSSFSASFGENITVRHNIFRDGAIHIQDIQHWVDIWNNSMAGSSMHGATLLDCDGVEFHENDISGSTFIGISVRSDGGRYYNNTAWNCGQSGITLTDEAVGNSVYYNIFYNNTVNGKDLGTDNVWDDDVSMGNYWDNAVDGSPYAIGNSQDRWPMWFDTLSPEIQEMGDLSFDIAETERDVVFNVSDHNPALFRVYVNDSEVDSGIWDGRNITVDMSGYVLGSYNLTLYVEDDNGNQASETLTVTIYDDSTSTTTDTTPTTDTPTTTPPIDKGGNLLFTPILLMGMGAGVIIVVLVVIMKRR